MPRNTLPRKSWRAALAAYATPASLALLLLGFAAGLPYMLVFSTLSVWLREAGVSHQTIGYASLIGLAYAFKWVWSPLLDQWRLPLLGRLGRRRSWLVLSQGLIALGLIGMALAAQEGTPIGRLLLHLYGVADARSLSRSDAPSLQAPTFSRPSRALTSSRHCSRSRPPRPWVWLMPTSGSRITTVRNAASSRHWT